MRRWRARSVLPVCAAVSVVMAACGGGGPGNAQNVQLSVFGVSAGFVPEKQVIRAAWLPVSHPSFEAYQVLRTAPFSLNDPITSGSTVPTLSQIGETTATTFDDPEVDPARKYGYAIRVLHIDNTTGPTSDLAWAPIPQSFSLIPDVAFETTDACEAVSAAATIDAIAIQPSVEARPGVREDINARFRISANLFDAGVLRSTWYQYPIDSPKIAISAPKNQALPERCSTLTRTYTDNNPTLNPLTAQTQHYAVGVEANFNNLQPAWRIMFPNDQARETLRLANVGPAPGSFLTLGVHVFSGDIVYDLDDTAGLSLAAGVEVFNASGTRQILDAKTFELDSPTGSVQFSSTVTLPANAVRARLLTRIGRGAYESLYMEDVVDYAVVP